MNGKIKIVNSETNEVIERDLTAEELAQREIDAQISADEKRLKAEKIGIRQAVLDRLGITEEEAKLLLS